MGQKLTIQNLTAAEVQVEWHALGKILKIADYSIKPHQSESMSKEAFWYEVKVIDYMGNEVKRNFYGGKPANWIFDGRSLEDDTTDGQSSNENQAAKIGKASAEAPAKSHPISKNSPAAETRNSPIIEEPDSCPESFLDAVSDDDSSDSDISNYFAEAEMAKATEVKPKTEDAKQITGGVLVLPKLPDSLKKQKSDTEAESSNRESSASSSSKVTN